jgi:hypothetical protein
MAAAELCGSNPEDPLKCTRELILVWVSKTMGSFSNQYLLMGKPFCSKTHPLPC